MSKEVKEAFQYIDDPEQYRVIFPSAMKSLQRTGYMALFISVVGVCILSCSGTQ